MKDENSRAPDDREDGKSEAASHQTKACSHAGRDGAGSAPAIKSHREKAASQQAYAEEREECLQQPGKYRQGKRLKPVDLSRVSKGANNGFG